MDLDETLRRRLVVSFISIGIFFPLAIFFFLQYFFIKSFAKANIRIDTSKVVSVSSAPWKEKGLTSAKDSYTVVSSVVSKRTTHANRRAQTLAAMISGDRVQVYGEGDFVRAVATKTDTGYAVILANNDPKNANKELVPLTIVNLPNGTYLLSIENLDGIFVKDQEVIVSDQPVKRTVFLTPNQIAVLKLVRQ